MGTHAQFSHSTQSDMLAIRRLAPQVRGVASRAIHQSAIARKDDKEATTMVAVEKKDESIAQSVSGLTGKTGPIIAAAALGTVAYANELLLIHAESVVVASFAVCVYGLYAKGGAVLSELIQEQKDEACARYDSSKKEAPFGAAEDKAVVNQCIGNL